MGDTSSSSSSHATGSVSNGREQRVPSAEELRDTWLQAVQQEDAAAAGWCARLCEGLRGAEAFANSDGLDAFLAVAMGQSTKTGSGGLMVALAQALMSDTSDYKVAIFETLAAAAYWPSLRGRIAGSGVLGVVTATLLAPRQPASVKALMVRLCRVLAVDTPEAARLGDVRRAEEFAKLRQQLISSGALKAIVAMAAPDSEASVGSAAAMAIASFSGPCSDLATRTELSAAGAVQVLLNRLSKLPAIQSTATTPGGDADSADEPDEVANFDPAAAAVAGALTAIAKAQGDDCTQLAAGLLERSAAERLRTLLGILQATGQRRQCIEEILLCLTQLGQLHGVWPNIDVKLKEDLLRLIALGSEAAFGFFGALLTSRKIVSGRRLEGSLSQLGDLRPLSSAVRRHTSPAATAFRKLLQEVESCNECGCAADQVMVCGGCRKVSYCSKECQKAAWKLHKAICTAKK